MEVKTLVRDIQKLLQNGADVNEHDEDVQLFLSAMVKVLRKVFNDRTLDSRVMVRPSNYGKPCKRQLWYGVHGESKEELTPEMRLKFLYGDILEQLLIFLARRSGHTVTGEQREVELNGIKGSIDCLIDGHLVDIKSASSYSFNKFKEGDLGTDSFGYVPQISFYKQALGKDTASFLVVDKTLGKLCMYTPEPEEELDVGMEVEEVKKIVNKDIPPERHFDDIEDGKSGNKKLGIECSYCQYKRMCWPNVRTFLYSTGPRFLTVVEKLPKVPEVLDNG